MLMNADEMKGKTLEELEEKAYESGLKTRVTEEDGVKYMVTADFRPDRANLKVRNGIVYDVSFG